MTSILKRICSIASIKFWSSYIVRLTSTYRHQGANDSDLQGANDSDLQAKEKGGIKGYRNPFQAASGLLATAASRTGPLGHHQIEGAAAAVADSEDEAENKTRSSQTELGMDFGRTHPVAQVQLVVAAGKQSAGGTSFADRDPVSHTHTHTHTQCHTPTHPQF